MTNPDTNIPIDESTFIDESEATNEIKTLAKQMGLNPPHLSNLPVIYPTLGLSSVDSIKHQLRESIKDLITHIEPTYVSVINDLMNLLTGIKTLIKNNDEIKSKITLPIIQDINNVSNDYKLLFSEGEKLRKDKINDILAVVETNQLTERDYLGVYGEVMGMISSLGDDFNQWVFKSIEVVESVNTVYKTVSALATLDDDTTQTEEELTHE